MRSTHKGHCSINLAAKNFKDLRSSGFSSDRKTQSCGVSIVQDGTLDVKKMKLAI